MFKKTAMLFVATAYLSGCVSVPDSDAPRATAEKNVQYQNSLSTEAGTIWPEDHWWSRYNDAQLDQLIELALKNAPDIAEAQARLDQAGAQAKQAGAAWWPQVGASASVNKTKISYHNGNEYVPRGWNTFGSGLLDFSYDLDFFGKNRHAIAAARSGADAAAAGYAESRLMLTTMLTQAYIEYSRLCGNEQNQLLARDIKADTLKLMTRRFDQGLENKGAVKRAEADLAMTQAALLMLQQQIEIQKHAIAALTGAGPDEGTALKAPSLKLDHIFGLPADTGINVIGRRPDIVAARWQTEAAAHGVGVAKAMFYPNVTLTGFIGTQAMGLDNLNFGESLAGGIGPAIYLPIFRGGQIKGAYKEANAKYDMAVAQYNQTLHRAFQQLADVSTQQKYLQPRLEQLKVAEASAHDAYEIASQRYKGGLATYLDVLTAQDAWLMAKRNLINLQAESMAIDIATVRALGGGYQNTPDHV